MIIAEKLITIPVTWDAANRKKDRSVSVRLTTNLEVTNQDFAEMDKHVGQSGWFMFKENEITPEELPKEDAPLEFEQKRPSVRLRNTLYRVWEQTTDHSEDFDRIWYPRQMEKIIQKYKEVLI